jgi:hypothetical protein
MYSMPLFIRGLDEGLSGSPLVVARINTANPLLTPDVCGRVTLKQVDGPRAQILELKLMQQDLWLQLSRMAWKKQVFCALPGVPEGSEL